MPVDEDALAIFDALDEDMTRRQRVAVGTDQSAVLARVWENTAKVALVKAVSANPAEPVIRGVDAQWAREVVDHCVATLLIQAERHLADNEIERNHKRVLEIIRAAGAGGVTKSELIRRTQFLDKRQRDEVIATLVEASMVSGVMRPSATKPTVIYRAASRERL